MAGNIVTQENTLQDMGWNLQSSYASLPKSFFSCQSPVPVCSPKLVVINHSLAKSLGLHIEALQSKDGVAMLAGNQLPPGAVPLAQAYAGHQYGNFTMLGDGRALLLGEQLTPSGERFDIQLKGSGQTPYSRRGDGRAALGPMLREYIISEAMQALGIATSRSLAVVATGEPVIRESALPGAVLTRVAASHLRIGTFQYVAAWGTDEELRALADYTLQRHFPDILASDADNPYLPLLREVIKRQAALIAKWQLVGFIHGVMNTDNMAISGETIDYGPCAFMDAYDPATVFSSIDLQGRYAYGNQPQIAGWNLARFAETLLPLLHAEQTHAVELAQEAVSEFSRLYRLNWLSGMRAKLGIFNEELADESLFEGLLAIMQAHHADYTNTFRELSCETLEDKAMFASPEFAQWHELWAARLLRQKESKASSQQLMQASNPAVIPRNHLVEAALAAAVKQEDYNVMDRLLSVLAIPYTYLPGQDDYFTLPTSSSLRYRTFCGT